MKLGRTLAIILVFGFAVGIYLFQHRIDKDIISIIPDEVSRNFSLDAKEQVTRIEIQDRAKKTEIVLEFLKDEGWMITAPGVYPAGGQTANGLVAALRFASKQTRIRADKEWGEYGLETPSLEIRLVTDKKKKAALTIGTTSPVGKAVYGRWTSERGYMLLPPELKSSFEVSLYDLREKRIFNTPPAQVQKVLIEMGPNSYEWKKEKGKWFWLEPVEKIGKTIPSRRMEFILAALSELYVKEFLDKNKQSKAELGFFMVHDRIRITGASGAEENFFFGNEVPVKNAYYGMKEETGKVILIDRVKVFQLLDILRAIENERDALDKVPLRAMTQSSGGASQ